MEVSAPHGQIWTFRDGRVARMEWFNTHREAVGSGRGRGVACARMDLRADERALYEGRPSWRALMTFYLGGIGLAAAVVVVLGILFDKMGDAVAIAVGDRRADAADRLRAQGRARSICSRPSACESAAGSSGRACRRHGWTGSRT